MLLELVQSENPAAARLMNPFKSLGFWLVGDNISREAVRDSINSGLAVEQVADFRGDIFKLIEAKNSPK